ncbi:MAG: alpha/beta hydrolase [Desulfobacterales bacterium]|jgi:pimeloyl-ACP methyl ester carboxylesterase
MPMTEANGAKLYYEDNGTGPQTIVFGHGLLFSCRMFDAQVEALKNRYRCVVFDFRGQGQSEVTRNGYDMDSLAADAADLIIKLNCKPCHFLGFSMGGFVGLRLAIRQPELLRSLILVDTSADPEPKENLSKYRILNTIARWIGPWAVANQVMPLSFGHAFMKDPQKVELRKKYRQYLVDNDKVGVTRAVKGVITRHGVFDQLKKINMPTLVIVGEQDIATVPEESERIHKSISKSKMVTIPNSGHMSPVEEPEAVNTALDEFLTGLQKL